MTRDTRRKAYGRGRRAEALAAWWLRLKGYRILARGFRVAAGEIDLIALDDALEKLAGLSERQARIIELRYFGGLTIDETAHVLGLGTTTVEDDWHLAKAWLRRELKGASP